MSLQLCSSKRNKHHKTPRLGMTFTCFSKRTKIYSFFLPEQQIISVWHQTLLQTRIPITANRRYTTLSITYSSTSPLYTDYLTLKIAKYAIWCPNFFHCTQSHRCFFCVCVPHPSFCISFTKKKRESKTQQTATVMGSACVRVCGWWKGRGEWISWTRGVVVIVVVCLVKFLCTKQKGR